jgi:hypothetical protein
MIHNIYSIVTFDFRAKDDIAVFTGILMISAKAWTKAKLFECILVFDMSYILFFLSFFIIPYVYAEPSIQSLTTPTWH